MGTPRPSARETIPDHAQRSGSARRDANHALSVRANSPKKFFANSLCHRTQALQNDADLGKKTGLRAGWNADAFIPFARSDNGSGGWAFKWGYL
jgi:hypothetical protein